MNTIDDLLELQAKQQKEIEELKAEIAQLKALA